MAEPIIKVKGNRFVFQKNPSYTYEVGQGTRFYDEKGRLVFFALITKCTQTKCLAELKKKRKGYNLTSNSMAYTRKPEVLAEDFEVSSSKKEVGNEQEPSETKESTNRDHYLVRGGIGGQISASAFGELSFLGSGSLSYGLVLSSRIAARTDLDMSSFGYGGRIDYHFAPFETKGFLGSLNVGMANVTYTAVEIQGVTSFTESETIPYLTITGGYKFWLGPALVTLGGGLSYMGYKKSFEDPNTNIVFENPYPQMDLALESSLGFSF